jgi:hypothetical protein
MRLHKQTAFFGLVFAASCQGERLPEGTTPASSAGQVGLQDAGAASQRDAVSTRLILRLTTSGQLDITDAVQFPGIIRTRRDFTGNYTYEVRRRGAVVAVGSLDLGFEMRVSGNGAPEDRIPQDSQSFFVDLPLIALDEVAELSIRLLRTTAAHRQRSMSPAAVQQLLDAGTLTPAGSIDPRRLGAFAISGGRRVIRMPNEPLARP